MPDLDWIEITDLGLGPLEPDLDDWLNVQETSGTTAETTTPEPITDGGADNTTIIVVGAVVLIILVVVGAWVLRRPQPSSDSDARSDPDPGRPVRDSGRGDVLRHREVVDKPSEITQSDSLTDIKKKKMEKVAVSDYEEARKQLEARKAGRVKADAQKRREESGEKSVAELAETAAQDDHEDETPPDEEEDDGILGAVDEDWGDVDFSGFSLGDGGLGLSDEEQSPFGEGADGGDAATDTRDSDDTDATNVVDTEADSAVDTTDTKPEDAEPGRETEDIGDTDHDAAADDEGDAEETEDTEDTDPASEDDDTGPSGDDRVPADKTPGLEPQPRTSEATRSLQQGLEKTRGGFISRIGTLFKKQETLDEDLLDELEEVLYTADIGPRTVEALIAKLQDGDASSPDKAWGLLREEAQSILSENARPLVVEKTKDGPFVLLVVGVNGVGKTTTIGKLATRFTDEGKRVLLVAGDTFRAAATEQLEEWGERTGLPVHVGKDGADAASVVFDGIKRAQEEDYDVAICDTAGRLTNKKNLMRELEKIARVSDKALSGAPHETLLVLDANTGLQAVQQAKLFQEVVSISGLVLTKLDGTAKGGAILGICQSLQVPVRFIGIGEGVYDLREFNATDFVDALFM